MNSLPKMLDSLVHPIKGTRALLVLFVSSTADLLDPARAASGSAVSSRVTVDTRGTNSATLIVTVRDATTDSPLPSVLVLAGSVGRTSDVSGRATFATAANGVALTLSKTNYSTRYSACVVPGGGTYYQTERLSPLLGTNVKPVINSLAVRPFPFTVQATGLNIPLFFVSDIAWGPGANGNLKYTTAVKSGQVARGSPTTTLRLNPTTDLPVNPWPVPRTYTVRLVAETDNGESPPLTREVIAIAMPAWLVNAGAAYAGADAPTAGELNVIPFSIRRELIPEEYKDLDIGIVTIESSLGFFASLSLGSSAGTVSGFQGTYGFEGGLDAGIKAKGNGLLPGGMKPYGAIEAEGKVVAEGTWYPALTCEGYLEIKLRGAIGLVVPVRAILLLDPTGAGTAFNAWVDTWPHDFRDALDDSAYLDASIGAHMQAKLPLGVSDGRLYLDAENGLLGLGTDLKIKGHVGWSAVSYVEGTLGGGGTVWFRSTSEGDTFDHAEYTIEGEVVFGFFQWEKSFDVEYKKTVPDTLTMSARQALSLRRPAPSGMRLVRRDYAQRPGGGAFVLGVQDVQARRVRQETPGPLGEVKSEVFVQDVFPNTTASLAGLSTNDVMVLFSYDNTNLVQVQAMDIYWTRFNGATWSAPTPAATNTQTELHPQVAMDSSNRPVGAWMRMRDPNYTDSTNVLNYLAQFDIVGSFFNVTSNRWTTPQVVSTNLCLNMAPQFARATSGALALWWESNPSNQLVGGVASSNNAPSQWWWARWDVSNAQFTGRAAIETNVVGGMSPSLVYGGTNAWLFWVQDRDRNRATSNDTALCYRYWNGAQWGTSVYVTATGQVALMAQAVMLTNGLPLAVWWMNGNVMYDTGPAFTNSRTARANSAALAGQKLNLAASPDNRYVLMVFPAATSNGLNLTYRVYDTRADVWGGDFAFESTNSLDYSLSPAFIGQQMWSAYTRGVLAYSSEVVSVGATNIVLSNIPYRVRTDLMLAKFDLDADISALSVDIPVTYPSVVQVGVANEGDTIVTNLVVQIRENSDAGPVVATFTNMSLLGPHTVDTLVIPVDTYSSSATRILVAILDPSNVIPEFREANNKVTNRVLFTAMAIRGIYQEPDNPGTNVWGVQAENLVARPISNATVILHRDATNGVVLGSTATNLPAYATIEMRMPFPVAGLDAAGAVLYTELTAPPAPGETNAVQVFLPVPYRSLTNRAPDAPTGLVFLRPGLSNSLPLRWTPPVLPHDGVRVVRTAGTNPPAEIGFAEFPVVVYADTQTVGLTSVTYRVATYNAMGASPLSTAVATNLMSLDENGDGLPDAWQIQYFGSLTNPAAAWTADGDSDGYANWQEYLFGSSPTNGAAFPRVRIGVDYSGLGRIQWDSAAGQTYILEYSTNCAEWLALQGIIVGSNGVTSASDAASATSNAAPRTYRVIAQ